MKRQRVFDKRPLVKGNKRRKSLGQGIVEFALVFPVLILIILGITELGVYFMTTHAVQNASRQTARMATTLEDLGTNDSRVLAYANGLIPNSGPTAGFYGGITNSTANDCTTTDQITVTVQGNYKFVALNFLGLSTVHLSYPTTMHYELCPPFASGGTATTTPTASRTPTPSRTLTPSRTPTASITLTPSRTFTASMTPTRTLTPSRTPTPSITLTPSRTPTASITPTPSRTPTHTATVTLTFTNTATVPSNTPTRTFTPSPNFTATRTPTASNTPTRTSTPSRTPTPNPPDPPVYVSATTVKSFSSCTNVTVTWDANSAWATYPGFGPSTYQRYRNGVAQGTVGANYPNNVSWNIGTLTNGQSVALAIEANFVGGLVSDQLSGTVTCNNGVLVLSG